jgi:hypothetical protein
LIANNCPIQLFAPDRSPSTRIAGIEVVLESGETVGVGVDSMTDCETGGLVSVIVRSGGLGGIGERLVELPRTVVGLNCGRVTIRLSRDGFDARPEWQAA